MEKEIVINGKTYVLKEETQGNDFEENDWVEWTGCNPTIGRISNQGGGDRCYVLKDFNGVGKYTSCYYKYLRKLSNSEIESYLMSEFEKRGYKEGVVVKCVMTGTRLKLRKFAYYYPPSRLDSDQLCFSCDRNGEETYCIVYKEGKWAEIIKEKPKYKRGDTVNQINDKITDTNGCTYNHRPVANREIKDVDGCNVQLEGDESIWFNQNDLILAEQPIKIGGYDVKFNEGYINVGCKRISNGDVRSLLFAKSFCYGNDMQMEVDGNKMRLYSQGKILSVLSNEDINKILNKLR